MSLKRSLFLVLVVLMVLLMACQRAQPQQPAQPEEPEQPKQPKIVIGYAPSDWDPSDFHGMFGAGIEAGLQEHGIEYEFLIRAAGDHTAHEIQLSIVEDFLAEGVDYVVINPTDFNAQKITYQKVLDAGVPLFVGNFNTPFPEEWGFQPTMLSGYSHVDAGIAMANYIKGKYPPGTKISIIKAAPGYVSDSRAQQQMYRDMGMNILYEEYAYGNRTQAYDTMERIITAYPDTEVVLALSSMMAVGAVEAVSAAGMDGKFAIYGAGGTIEELLNIEQGLMAGAWSRDNVAMGKAVGEAIYLHMNGRENEIPAIFNSPIHVIDSVEAINKYINPILYKAEGLAWPR